MTTHWNGPLLGSDRAGGGCLEDVQLAAGDRARGPYKVHVENFDVQVASGAAALTTAMGVTVSDINTATAPAQSITGANGYLLIDPGTKAASGTEIQFGLVPDGTTVPTFSTVGPMISTSTLMVGRELVWYSRVGLRSNATTWDGHALLGWWTADTSLMDNTNGNPTVATGGGIGFHIGESGLIRVYCATTAFTSASTSPAVESTGITLGTGSYAFTANQFRWFTFGFRAQWSSTSSAIGNARFYIDDRQVAVISRTSAMAMTSTQAYSVTYGIHNGPALLSDLAVSQIVTAVTRPTT